MKLIIKNKKGTIGIILFFVILLMVLIIGFVAVIIWSVVDIASDEITPVMTELGVIEGTNTNLSEYSEWGFGTSNKIIQSLPWIIVIGYVMTLIFTLVFVFMVGYNPHPAFISLYIALFLLLIFGCIIVSNIYQDMYTGTDEVAIRLQQQDTMSYFILHSPFIMAIIAIIGGILMFARQNASEGGSMGGYGI